MRAVQDISPPDQGRIAGRFCELVPLDPARHAGLYALLSDDGLWDYMSYGPFADENAYRAWQETMAAKADPFFYAVESGGRTVGHLALMRMDATHRVAEVGHILFAPEVQRTVISSEAVMLLVRRAFDAGYRRVEWKCNCENAASRRAALRFGFVYEGRFRQHMIVKGKNRDTDWFSIIDRDWPELCARWDAWLHTDNMDDQGRQKRPL